MFNCRQIYGFSRLMFLMWYRIERRRLSTWEVNDMILSKLIPRFLMTVDGLILNEPIWITMSFSCICLMLYADPATKNSVLASFSLRIVTKFRRTALRACTPIRFSYTVFIKFNQFWEFHTGLFFPYSFFPYYYYYFYYYFLYSMSIRRRIKSVENRRRNIGVRIDEHRNFDCDR